MKPRPVDTNQLNTYCPHCGKPISVACPEGVLMMVSVIKKED